MFLVTVPATTHTATISCDFDAARFGCQLNRNAMAVSGMSHLLARVAVRLSGLNANHRL